MRLTSFVRGAVSIAALVATFLTFRVFVPGLVNMQNDGALVAAFVLGFAVPTAAFVALVQVWTTETFE